jgi:DNA invertase Pin-like site-specific DNA recombinase
MTDFGYARVSTAEQNLDLQLDALRKANCDVIREEKASGKAGIERPVQEAILRELQPGDTLSVWRLDRLGRYSFMDIYQTVKGLHERGINFRSLTESIDLNSPTGELVLILISWFAELERRIIIERTIAGKAARVESGLHPGGPRIYGFAEDKRTHRETVIEHERARLIEAATHALSGDPLAKLVDQWNADGVPTARGGDARWHETALKHMLLNPDLVPLILSKQEHDDLVKLFAPATERQAQGRPATHLLSGVLVCGECGAPMYTVVKKDRDGSRHTVYVCRIAYGGRPSGCGKVSIRSEPVEAWISKAAMVAVCSERFTDMLNAKRSALLEGGPTSEQLADMEAELIELETILGTRYGDQYRSRYEQLQQAVQEAHRRLLARPELQQLMDLPRTREAWQTAWDSWDVPERRKRLKLLLHKITVKAVGKASGFDPSRLVPDWRL